MFKTEDPASFSLLTIGDLEQRKEVFAIRIPKLLSLLSSNKLSGEVKGIDDLQAQYQQEFAARYGPDANYRPAIAFIYWSFRAMVGSGFLMLALVVLGLYLVVKRRLADSRRLLRWLPWAIVLPYIANTGGWVMTEMGRQPWIVFGLQRTEDAVSPNVSTAMVAFSLVLFAVVYGVLMAVDGYLLMKFGKRGPVEEEAEETGPALAAA
jgi:cytochrome d ubiquinol oxidase subunit I